jgi:hypothetical protein
MKRAVIGEDGRIASLHDTDEHALAELAYLRAEHRKNKGKCTCGVDDVEDTARVGDFVGKAVNPLVGEDPKSGS